ncbi:hypothetical protein ACO1O0_005799 [Amphichorda felina]
MRLSALIVTGLAAVASAAATAAEKILKGLTDISSTASDLVSQLKDSDKFGVTDSDTILITYRAIKLFNTLISKASVLTEVAIAGPPLVTTLHAVSVAEDAIAGAIEDLVNTSTREAIKAEAASLDAALNMAIHECGGQE